MGPRGSPGMIADKCACKKPIETEQTWEQLMGMTMRDFYQTSAEEYVKIAEEQEQLEEDLE